MISKWYTDEGKSPGLRSRLPCLRIHVPVSTSQCPYFRIHMYRYFRVHASMSMSPKSVTKLHMLLNSTFFILHYECPNHGLVGRFYGVVHSGGQVTF
jgi:hypothetical protein